MGKILYVTKRVNLDFNQNAISINDIDIEDVLTKYNKEYIIDYENNITLLMKDELLVTFKLIKKEE
jgi:hypothetical protein